MSLGRWEDSLPLLLRSGDTAQEVHWAPEGGGVNRPVCFSLCKELGERPTLHELCRTDRGLLGLAGVAECVKMSAGYSRGIPCCSQSSYTAQQSGNGWGCDLRPRCCVPIPFAL